MHVYNLGHEVGNFIQLLNQFEITEIQNIIDFMFWYHGGAYSGCGSDDKTADDIDTKRQQLPTLSRSIDNEFFNTCTSPTRYTNNDLPGESIFYSTNATTSSKFSYYKRDLASNNYVEFLDAVRISLPSDNNGANLAINTICHSTIPSDLTFYVNDIENEYNSNCGLYIIVAQCGYAVVSAQINVYLHLYANDTNFDIELVSIDSEINHVNISSRETKLKMLWDGKIALFSDDSNDEMDMNKTTSLSPGSTKYYFENDGVPIVYTIQYQKNIYQVDDVTDNKRCQISIPDNANKGYSQTFALIGSENQS